MNCRGCNAELRHADVMCDLGAQPLANALLSEDDLNNPEVCYPLRPLVCRECLLVQLPDVPDPEGIFTESYPFFAGQSATWLVHCKQLATDAIERLDLGPTSRVLDIGSNDGSMLRPFRGKGIPCLGVEPCAGVAQHALMEGLPTVIDWWGAACAERLLHTEGVPIGKGWKADLVTCTNVLAHVPDLADFLTGIRMILAPTGVAMFEVPNVARLLEDCQFDQIYAEHHCYFSLTSLSAALERSGLRIVAAEHQQMHGGSLRVYAGQTHHKPQPHVATMLAKEQAAGLGDPAIYLNFAGAPQQAKHNAWAKLIDTVRSAVSPELKQRVVGYGASAKAAVTLNYFGMGPESIEFVADTTPAKWGKYLPGSHIPVYGPRQLAEAKPDIVVNLLWNWREESERRIREACPNAEIIYLRAPPPKSAPVQVAESLLGDAMALPGGIKP